MTELSYAGQVVRKEDHDRYLTAVLAPEAEREGLFALYAFNVELAKVRETVSEELIGHMRLQWWRDNLDAIFAGSPPKHPAAAAFSEAVTRFGLSRAPVETLLEARGADLDDAPPPDMAALETYAANTSVPLVQLALEVLGARSDATEAAAQDVGTAWALTGLMRAVPFHGRRRQSHLPQDLVRAAGLDTSKLFDRGPQPELAGVVAQVAERARVLLSEARRQARQVPKRAAPALLIASLAESYLNALEKAGYDPFNPSLGAPRVGRLLRLYGRHLLGRF